jgi:superfamily I DNA/RNA helicase
MTRSRSIHSVQRRCGTFSTFQANSIRLQPSSPSIATIVRHSRSLLQPTRSSDLASERFTKNLWSDRTSAERPQLVTVRDEADQARYVVERVLDNREGGIALKQQAVLFRTSHHSGPLEIELTRRNIPFVKFGGFKFLDSAHVKDVLAMLRFVANPA